MPKVLGVKDGSISSQVDIEKKDKRYIARKKLELTYYVLGDDLDTNEDEIVETTGIPPLFYPYNGTWCKSRSAKETNRVFNPITFEPAGLWEVACSFDSDVDPEEDKDPDQKTPVVRWVGETEEEVLEKDAITGDPVQTDAEEPIILTTPCVLPMLEIKRYERYPFDPDVMLTYSHKTNSKKFWGAPPGSALMLPMTVDEETIDGKKWCPVTYHIKFKIKPGQVKPWMARVLHHGFKHRKVAGEKPVIFMDKHGNPATVNLTNGTGVIKAGAPDYKEFNRFTEINFNNLSLGPF